MIDKPDRAVFLLYLPFFAIVFAVALYARLPADPAPYLWADESWRAYAILSTGDFPDFLRFMREDRHFPLFSEWLFGNIGLAVFGFDEFAFRIWPLIFSLLSIVGAGAEGIEKGRKWPSPRAEKVFSILGEHYRPGDAVKFNPLVTYTFLLYRDRLFQHGNLSELADIPARKVLERGINEINALLLCRSLRLIIDDIRQAERVWFLTTFTWEAYKLYQKVLPLLGDVETLLGEPRRGLILLKPDQAAPALDCSRFEAKEGRTGRS